MFNKGSAAESEYGSALVIDSENEFASYSFPGFLHDKATCYLKYAIKNDRCLVVIAQLPDYFGTDITSGFKEIVHSFAKHLLDESIIQLRKPHRTLFGVIRDLMFRDLALQRDTEAVHLAALDFVRKANWVACYPPGVGLIAGEAFALVRMDEQLNYKFDYRRKEVISEYLGIDDAMLSIDYSRLEAASGDTPKDSEGSA